MRAFDFYLVESRKKPRSLLKAAAKGVFGNYMAEDAYSSEAECGLLAMPFGKLKIVKFDFGPWDWYTEASDRVASGLCKALGRRLWVCGYAIDQPLSYVHYHEPHNGEDTLVEVDQDPDGPKLTARVLDKYGFDMREAAAELKKRTMWEAKRRWMIADRDRRGNMAMHSFMIGKLLLRGEDQALMEDDWKEVWGKRRPTAGPLHEQLYFIATSAAEKYRPRGKFVFKKEGRVEIRSEMGDDGVFKTTDVKRIGAQVGGPAGADLLGPTKDQPALSAADIARTKGNVRKFLDRIKGKNR